MKSSASHNPYPINKSLRWIGRSNITMLVIHLCVSNVRKHLVDHEPASINVTLSSSSSSSSSSDGLQALVVRSVFPHHPAVLSEEGAVPPVLPGGPAKLPVHPAR